MNRHTRGKETPEETQVSATESKKHECKSTAKGSSAQCAVRTGMGGRNKEKRRQADGLRGICGDPCFIHVWPVGLSFRVGKEDSHQEKTEKEGKDG